MKKIVAILIAALAMPMAAFGLDQITGFNGCTATESMAACEVDPRGSSEITVGQTSCRRVDITCDAFGTFPAELPTTVELRVSSQCTGYSCPIPKGTIVLGSGEGGDKFYEDTIAQDGNLDDSITVATINALLTQNYVVIQRKWLNGGWTKNGVGGVRSVARRGAVLFKYIKAFEFSGVKFCASGNSAGASELAYSMAWHSNNNLFNGVVLTSGPAMSDLVKGCYGDFDVYGAKAPANWYKSSAPVGTLSQTKPDNYNDIDNSLPDSCFYNGGSYDGAYVEGASLVNETFALGTNAGICTKAKLDLTSADKTTLTNGASLTGGLKNFPNTKVSALFGGLDCGEPVPLALEYLDGVTDQSLGQAYIGFIAGADHNLVARQAGSDAFLAEVSNICN